MRTISTWRTLAMVAGIVWAVAAAQAVAASPSSQDLYQAAAQMKLAAKQAKTLAQALERARPDESTIESAMAQVKSLSKQVKGAQAVLARYLLSMSAKTQAWFEGPLAHINMMLDQLPFMLATDRDLINASGTLKTLADRLEFIQGEATSMAQRAGERVR